MKSVKSKRLNRAKKDGFTLVEAMFATILLGISSIGGYSVVSQSIYMVRGARDHYLAASLAQNRIERLHNYDNNELALLEEDGVRIDEEGAADSTGLFKRTTIILPTEIEGVAHAIVKIHIYNRRSQSFTETNESMQTLLTDFPQEIQEQ